MEKYNGAGKKGVGQEEAGGSPGGEELHSCQEDAPRGKIDAVMHGDRKRYRNAYLDPERFEIEQWLAPGVGVFAKSLMDCPECGDEILIEALL
jgi:hypothetical protein